MRFAPKDYIEEIRREGGFAWIFEYQLYPFGTEEKVNRVRERLGIKVDSPAALWEGTIRRFVRWHEALVSARLSP